LLIGGAPCAMEDQARARVLSPVPFEVISINGAWAMLDGKPKLPFAIITAHGPEEFAGNHNPPAGIERHQYDPQGHKCQASDFCWSGVGGLSTGTSSLCAAIIALQMGFQTVILCGVPLSIDGYSDRYIQTPGQPSEFAPGDKKMNGTFLSRHITWGNYANGGALKGVYSMSGKPREILGEPSFLKEYE